MVVSGLRKEILTYEHKHFHYTSLGEWSAFTPPHRTYCKKQGKSPLSPKG